MRSVRRGLSTLPQHSVSAWIGHLMKAPERHYLQITDDLYNLASGSAAVGRGTASQHAAKAEEPSGGCNEKAPPLPLVATNCEAMLSEADGTRTRNHRIDSRMVTSKSGDDNIAEGHHLRQKPLAAWATRAAESAADLAGNGVIEPDLTTWLHTCPIPLDDAQRDAIRAIVGE